MFLWGVAMSWQIIDHSVVSRTSIARKSSSWRTVRIGVIHSTCWENQSQCNCKSHYGLARLASRLREKSKFFITELIDQSISSNFSTGPSYQFIPICSISSTKDSSILAPCRMYTSHLFVCHTSCIILVILQPALALCSSSIS